MRGINASHMLLATVKLKFFIPPALIYLATVEGGTTNRTPDRRIITHSFIQPIHLFYLYWGYSLCAHNYFFLMSWLLTSSFWTSEKNGLGQIITFFSVSMIILITKYPPYTIIVSKRHR